MTLNNNGTFTFHDQGCYGQRFSQGQWTNAHNSISLTSFDNFKPKEQIDNIKTEEASEQEKAKPKSNTSDAEYSFVGFKNIPPPTFPGSNDTVRIYLDNIQLRLRNDTLYCVGSNKLPEEAKFYKTKNNR